MVFVYGGIEMEGEVDSRTSFPQTFWGMYYGVCFDTQICTTYPSNQLAFIFVA